MVVRIKLRQLPAAVLACAMVLLGLPAQANPLSADPPFEEIRAADMRLATLGWRLVLANAPLCDRLEPGTGIQIHTLDQFDSDSRAAAEKHFGFETAVAIEGIIAGSPAERAGLKPDDSLVRIGRVEVAALAGRPGSTDRLVEAQLAIAALAPSGPLEVEVLRDGQPVRVVLQPVPICKTRFELELSNRFEARADGEMVQVASRFLDTYADDILVVPVAHELSHNILRHAARLDARGVSFGMLSGFGGNVKYFRQSELQADILSVYLMANAGFEPRGALAFWQDFGPRNSSIFLSRSHPKWRDRIATLTAEIAKIEAQSARPIIPAIVAERDRPLDGNWQALIVKHR